MSPISRRELVTVCFGGFPGTNRHLREISRVTGSTRHLVWYRSDDECLDLIGHYLDRPDERARIAAEGQRHVRERYPLAEQVRTLLAFLDELHVAS